MNKKELGIYIHIPFCKKKCYYCDFVSYANNCKNVEEYKKTVIKEIESYNLENYNITTIYIGGGTPSYIDSKYIVEILAKLKQKLQNNETKFNNIEITIEVNPGTITNSKIKDYKKSGINRISIGLQSTNNNLLKEIGRIHTFEEFLEAYNIVKKEFDNINIDLMIGLPKQKILDIKKSLEEIIKLIPNHVSVYSLILEEGTVLYKKVENNDLELPSEDEERKMYWYVKNTLELNGYKHYEISNFAKNALIINSPDVFIINLSLLIYISKAKSKVGAFATIALDDIISTPVDAIALTVSNFTFPLASTIA